MLDKSLSKKKILIVEDNPTLREIYVETLKNEGYDVQTANDGEEGYRAIADPENNYDLVMLDVIMPKMNGIQILDKLHKEYPSKKFDNFIVLTNVLHKDAIKDIFAFGVKDYLIKDNSTPGDIANIAKKYLISA